MDDAPRSDRPDRRVRVSKTAELIADELRSQIAGGLLKQGDVLLPEPELVSQFGVSRPTLREAFRILEHESLIEVRRGSRGGVIVTHPEISVAARNFGLIMQLSGATLADLWQARGAVEPTAVRWFATRRTAEDVAELRDSIEALTGLVDVGTEGADFGSWSKAAFRFHDAILERCGNTTLALIGAVLREVFRRQLSQAAAVLADRADIERQFKKSIKAFVILTEMIAAGDADEAEAYWRRHMERATSVVPWSGVAGDAVLDLFTTSPVLRQLSAPRERRSSISSHE